MKPAPQLRVFQLARTNLRTIHTLTIPRFGDLRDQIQRSALSVVSNIAEACGTHTDRNALKFLSIAKASNSELQAQVLILADLGAISDTHGDANTDALVTVRVVDGTFLVQVGIG